MSQNTSSSNATTTNKGTTQPQTIVVQPQTQTTTVVQPPTQTTVVSETMAPELTGGTVGPCNDTVGRPTIQTGYQISCGFAQNIMVAAANYYKSNGTLPNGVTLSVHSPNTGLNYNVAYNNDGSTVNGTNISSSGTSNWVSFPASDANGIG